MSEIDELIAKYGIDIDTPEIEGVENNDVFLVRHGFSQFNYLHRIMENPKDHSCEEWFALKRDPLLCDPDLHPIGVR